MNRPQTKNDLQPIISEQKHLFWWVPENDLPDLSVDAVVEAILSNGDENAVRHLFNILGVEKVAQIFHKQTSAKRTNYRPRTIHYFCRYFQRHAPKYSNNKTD
jgi:hypothetical protein